jgi:uncharacterized membrane protein
MSLLLRAYLRHHRQLAVILSLGFATSICLGLLALRMLYAHSFAYMGFAWNLFLAWLPMLCALTAYNVFKHRSSLSWLMVAGCAGVWLLFFPNAPYLMTDIIHLQPRSGVPFWYDLILVLAFAWTGFFLGLVSLYLMQSLVRKLAGGLASWAFALGALSLSGFGIYLGRFLRWNSWDVFFSPLPLLADVVERVRYPMLHLRTFGFSALFSLFIISAYLMLVALTHLPAEAPRRAEN